MSEAQTIHFPNGLQHLSLMPRSSSPLHRQSSEPVPSSATKVRQRHSSVTSLRSRPKSPGRRLTDSYERSAAGIEWGSVESNYSVARRATLANLQPLQCDENKLRNDCKGATSGLSMLVDSPERISRIMHKENNNNLSIFQSQDSNPVARSLIFQNIVCKTEQISDGSPPKKRMKVKNANLCANLIANNKGKEHCGKMRFFLTRLVLGFFRVAFKLMSISLALGLIVFLMSFGTIWMRDRCKQLQSSHFELNKIEESLNTHVVGQSIAATQITSLLEKFHDNDFTEPHLMWCVGWTGTGKSKSMDVLKYVVANQSNVQYFIPTFLPSSDEALNSLIDNAISNMNPCLKDIIIIDGWDNPNDEVVLRFVSGLINKAKEQSQEDDSANHLLVVVAGVRGSKAINREYLAQRLLDKERVQLSIQVFVNVISRTEDYDLINPLAPMTIVPYLPLEASHVAECIRKELAYMNKLIEDGIVTLQDADKMASSNESDIIASVLERLSFLPADNPMMSASGCKRVLSTLRLVLGDLETIPTNF